MLRLIALLAAAAFLGCANSPATGVSSASRASDAAEIYSAFLDAWTDDKKDPVNVSKIAEAPTADTLAEFSDCAHEAAWMPVEPIYDLSSVIGNLAYVRLVDPNSWSPRDPRDLIAQGQSIESAVASGFDSGLATFSAIAFDESHTTAAFSFSFACGSLCGSGRTVVYKRMPTGWAEVDAQCGARISQTPGGRPNKSVRSFPSTPGA